MAALGRHEMPALGYHAMRMRWCRAALLDFLRRWAVYLAVGGFLIVAGMAGGVGDALLALRAMCAWLVLPLFSAVAEPLWVVPATLLQASIGAAMLWGMRPLLWPQRWAAAERALPLVRRDTLRSDAVVVVLGLVPLAGLCAVGAQALVGADPAWLHPTRGRAVIALCSALAGSALGGVVILQGLRQPPRQMPMMVRGAMPRRAASALVARAGWPRVLLWWPLWRGTARRSGRAGIAACVALCLPAIGLLAWPAAASWCLAAYAWVALLAVTRLNALARFEFMPLLAACAPLPLKTDAVARAREWLALLPLVSMLPLLAALPSNGVRPAVLCAYLLSCAGSCAFEVRSQPTEPSDKATRWLFSAVLMTALASEVMR